MTPEQMRQATRAGINDAMGDATHGLALGVGILAVLMFPGTVLPWLAVLLMAWLVRRAVRWFTPAARSNRQFLWIAPPI
jgi:UPF0716 family protein affecting phage T7 exclusion